MALRRDPTAMHRTAYTDAELWHDYKLGQRVMTRDGIAGTVTDVQDGMVAGNESYIVQLDGGVGGGEYRPSDLTPLGGSIGPITSALSDLHEASDDYPELFDILRKRLPPENTVAAIKEQAAREAGWQVVDDQGAVHSGPFDTVYEARDALAEEPLDPSALNVVQEPTFGGETMWTDAGIKDKMLDWYADKTHYEPGRATSFDWCRFRREQHCWYPKDMDMVNSRRTGYAVWITEDRGYCPRNTWDDQEQCPVGEPGPHSGDPKAQIEVTRLYDEGGQRVSIRTKADPELSFHFHATWTDVRNKAKRIRSEGHVRVISATAGYVTAEVRGDTNIYQTTIMRVPGGKSTAMWECGCAWANYSWGRSGRWKKYEGRMCAHALALTYEAQAQEMFGKEISEQRNMPQWRNDPTIPIVRPGDARTKPQPWRVGMADHPKVLSSLAWPVGVLQAEALFTREGWHPAVEPYLDPLMKKLVDYKPDRPLSDPNQALILKSVLPGISWTPYSRVPFFDQMHDLMGAEPTKDAVVELEQDRNSLFGKLPTKSVHVDPHNTVFTQSTVNGPKVQQMIANGIAAGGPPAFLVHYQGRDYVIDGHHRLVSQLLKGIYDINAKVLDFDTMRSTSALVVVALPMLKADPSIDEIVDWYQRAAKQEEGRVSRDVKEIAAAEAGNVAGFANRIKEPESLERKLRDKGPEKQRQGLPPEDWVTDALRYTIVFHPAIYTKAVQDALYRFEEKGYRIPSGNHPLADTAQENMWQRGDSYSGLHYLLTDPGGLTFEMQFHTATSYVLKQYTLHKMLEEFRKPSTTLRRKQELFDTMTKYWDEVEIPKDVLGKPERDLKGFEKYRRYERPGGLRPACLNPHWASLDADLAMSPAEAIRIEADLMARVRGVIKYIVGLVGDDRVKLSDGTTVPVNEVRHPKYDPNRGITDFHPSLSRSSARDTPASSFGLHYDADLLTHPEVMAAQEYDGWGSLPITTVSPHGLYAIESMLSSSSINKVVSGAEPLREGYDAHVARLSDGREVVIDGHHRAAMATSMQQPLRAHVLDMSTQHTAYYWKSTGEEISVADLEQIALDHGYTEQDLKSKKADTDKMYPHWLMGVTRPFVYQMWGGPDAPLTLKGPEPSTPWLPRFKHDWDDDAYDDGEDHGLVAAAARTPWTSEDGQYELLSSAGGRSYTHVGIGETVKGQSLALCGTTVAPASIKRENYMMAMGQATCQRCLDILLRHHQGSHFEADIDLDEATLHDEPEPALPETDGGDSEISEISEEERGNLASIGLQGSLEAPGATTPTGPAWLAPGTANNGSARMQAHQAANAELANMAREFLKHGSKVFSVEEQQAIINEDTGEPAANLDLLQIEGTHYEQIQRLNQDEMSDETWLM